MRRFLILIVAAVSLAAQVSTASGTAISFAFGRVGGNINPFTVTIASDGSVTATGPVRPLKRQLGARALALLTKSVTAQHFFTLPRSTRCPNTLPDYASQFIMVHRGGVSRRVLVHGDCSPRFARTYAALTKAVGL
jgi:hypothetical protein